MDDVEDKLAPSIRSVDEILLEIEQGSALELLQTGGPYDEEDQSEEEIIPVVPIARASPKAVSFDANVKFPPECDEPQEVKMKPEAFVEKLKLDLAKAKTELASERSNRKRKEKSLIKLAKELSNRVVEEKEYMKKIAELEETNKDLETRLVRRRKMDTTETSYFDAVSEAQNTETEIREEKNEDSENKQSSQDVSEQADESKKASELALSNSIAMKELITRQQCELKKYMTVDHQLRKQLEELENDQKTFGEPCESCLELRRQLEKLKNDLEATQHERIDLENEKESAAIEQLRQQLQDARREADIAEEELAATLTKREYSQEVVQRHLKMSQDLRVELVEANAELEQTKTELAHAFTKMSEINRMLEDERTVNSKLVEQLQSSRAQTQQARNDFNALNVKRLSVKQETNEKLLAAKEHIHQQVQTQPVAASRNVVEESVEQKILSDQLDQVKSEAALAQQQILDLSERLASAENSARNEFSFITDNLSRELSESKVEVEHLKVQLSSSVFKETSLGLAAKENMETIQKLRRQLHDSQAEATSLRKKLFAAKQTTAVRAARVEEKLIIQLRQELLDSKAEAARHKSLFNALREKCESSEWLQEKLRTLLPDFQAELPNEIDTLNARDSWRSKTIRVSVIFQLIAFAIALLSILTARLIMLHKTVLTDALCAPVIPGHEFREPLQAKFEAPWWAPQAAKKQAFKSICGERLRTRLDLHGDKVTIYALNNDSYSESIRSGRIGFGLRCGYDKLIIKNKRGSFEEVVAPWSLRA
jgi:DNA repair exonuclease SbcCD ATPase subunit